MHTKDRLIELLPYYLQNGENINKYYKVLSYFYDELIDIFIKIIDSKDIDKAELYALDIIGDIVNQLRTEKNREDEKYRNRLKTKVMQNNSMGHTEDINGLANAFLGENFIGVRQGYQYKDLNNEPAMVEIMLNGNYLTKKIKDIDVRYDKVGSKITGLYDLNKTDKHINYVDYKPLFLPQLNKAIAISVRPQYRIKDEKELLKIKSITKVTFKDNTIIKAKSITKVTFSKETKIKIDSKINIIKQIDLQCGTTCVSAQMGVLL